MPKLCALQYAQLSCETLLRFQTTLQAMEKALPGLGPGGITVGTLCSGTDLILYALDILTSFWEKEYGIRVATSHLFACEVRVASCLLSNT
jgi:hypothetical protein